MCPLAILPLVPKVEEKPVSDSITARPGANFRRATKQMELSDWLDRMIHVRMIPSRAVSRTVSTLLKKKLSRSGIISYAS